MPSSFAKFWQTLRPLRKVGKLRGVIEIPTFSVNCGSRYSYDIDGTGAINCGDTAFLPTTDFTIRAWVKIQDLNVGGGTVFQHIILGNEGYTLYVSDSKLCAMVHTSDYYLIQEPPTILADTWYYVCLVYSGQVLKMYVDSILVGTSEIAGVGNITYATAVDTFYVGGDAFGTSAFAYVSGVECWTEAWTAERIAAYKYTFPYSQGFSTLKHQLLLRETAALGFTYFDQVTQLSYSDVGDPTTTPVNDFPHDTLYGTSFICGKFVIDTSASAFSLKFPIVRDGSGYDFVLCVVAANGIRYKFWDNDQFIYPSTTKPANYSGQKLNDLAEIEIWSLEGNETANLTTAISVDTSLLAIVTSPSETTQTTNATLSVDTLLATEEYAVDFPMTFDEQQVYTLP